MPSALALRLSAYDAGVVHPAHDHSVMHLSMVLAGSLEECVGGEYVRAGPLSVVCKDPGVRHADRFGPKGATIAQLSIERSLTELVDEARGTEGWIWRHRLDVARPFLRLVARAQAGAGAFDADDDDVVSLLGALTARHAPARGEPPAWVCAAVNRVRDGEVSSVRELAARAEVHPVYMTRCLRRWYGVGAGDLIRAERVRRAASLLADTASTVSAVAHATGFADEPHLHRSFRAATGQSPRGFRILRRGSATRRSAPAP